MKQIKHGKTKSMKVCDIVPYDNNYIVHSPEQIEKVKRSIEEFGYRAKVGVSGKGVIVYGHSRISALMQINPNMTIEVDDLSDLAEEQCDRLRVVDNSLQSDDIDDKKLHAELKKIFPKLQDNVANIQETMNIDISHIARKMERDMAKAPQKQGPDDPEPAENEITDDDTFFSDKPATDPRPQRQASTKLAKIILEYTREDFDKVKTLSEKMSAKYGVTSTSDLFLKMLEAG